MSWDWWYFGVKSKKNLLASFWLKNHHLTLCRQDQIVSAAGRKLRNLNFNKILLGKTLKGPNGTVSCQKIQKTRERERERERGENYEILNLTKSCSGLWKVSRGLIALVVPKKLEKTERICLKKIFGAVVFH